MFNSILEFIFSASHGSVSSYKREKGRIIPNLLEYENSSKEDTILNDVQRGAIMFVRDFNEINKYLHIDKTPEQAFSNLKKMFLKPTLKDANMWGELEFCDYEKKKIASPKSIWYYLVHPKRFVKEFRESWWRPGFIKRVFKVNLPYINLLKWYKRRKYNEK